MEKLKKWRLASQLEWLALSLLVFCFFVLPISVSFTTMSFLLAFLCTLLFLFISNEWQSRWERLKHNQAALSFWVLFALFLIGLLYTTSTAHLAFQDLQKRHWMLITPFLIIMIKDEIWRRRMFNGFLLAMVITLLLSCLKWLHVSSFYFLHKTPIHGSGIFNYHIVQNFAMSIAAFICGHRAFFEKKWRAFYFFLLITMGINIFLMSAGRTGYVIFFLLMIYLAVIKFKLKGLLASIFISLLLMGTVYYISTNFHARIKAAYVNTINYDQATTKSDMNDINQRIEMYVIAKKMILQHPWFGYGTGGIRTALQKIIPPNERIFNPKIDYVESIYLNFLLEFGVFGLIILIGVLLTQILITFKLPRDEKHIMQAFLIAILIGGVFNSFFVSYTISHFYSLFSVLCFSALPMKKLSGKQND